MRRFVEGMDRGQSTLFPECLEDWLDEDNPVRVVDVFVDELDLAEVEFSGVEPEVAGRPSYHPSVPLKLYIYGSLNRVQSSRRLQREALRNVEVMWLLGRLAPDHKTIADFRKDNGLAIRQVCARFIELCRTLGLLAEAWKAGITRLPWYSLRGYAKTSRLHLTLLGLLRWSDREAHVEGRRGLPSFQPHRSIRVLAPNSCA
jgi:transposase